MSEITTNIALSQVPIEALREIVTKTIPRAIFVAEEKKKPEKKIRIKQLAAYICEECGKRVARRSNKWAHERTEYHNVYKDINIKMRLLLFPELANVPEKNKKLIDEYKKSRQTAAEKAEIQKEEENNQFELDLLS
jgi:uncharacterized protein YlaI